MTSSAIKLSPAMVTALKGSIMVTGGLARVSDDTKSQTVKGLESRGLTDTAGYLTDQGVEAARQLGAELAFAEAELPSDSLTDDVQVQQQDKEIQVLAGSMNRITPEMVTQAAENLLKTPEQRKALEELAHHVDKPVIVPNREDKRKAKFKLRGAFSRLVQRQKARRMAKYGSTKFGDTA